MDANSLAQEAESTLRVLLQQAKSANRGPGGSGLASLITAVNSVLTDEHYREMDRNRLEENNNE